ncbi:unnamed protein product [Closterium sp. NIES-65]|nr:unnamed protein product [Closterium sp. NIES-65]
MGAEPDTQRESTLDESVQVADAYDDDEESQYASVSKQTIEASARYTTVRQLFTSPADYDPARETHYVLVVHGTFDSPPAAGNPPPWYFLDAKRADNFCHLIAKDLKGTPLGFDAVWRQLPDSHAGMRLREDVPYPFHWSGHNTHEARVGGERAWGGRWVSAPGGEDGYSEQQGARMMGTARPKAARHACSSSCKPSLLSANAATHYPPEPIYSTTGPPPFPLPGAAGKALAQLIHAVGRADPSARVHVVAHSHGGNVALKAVSKYLSMLRRDSRDPARASHDQITAAFWEAHAEGYRSIKEHQQVKVGAVWMLAFAPFLVVKRPWRGDEALGAFPYAYFRRVDSLLGLPKRVPPPEPLLLRSPSLLSFKAARLLHSLPTSLHSLLLFPSSHPLRHSLCLSHISPPPTGHNPATLYPFPCPSPTPSPQGAAGQAARTMAGTILALSVLVFVVIVGAVVSVKYAIFHEVNTADLTGGELTFWVTVALVSVAVVVYNTLSSKRYSDGNVYFTEKKAWSPAMSALVLNAGKLDEAALALSTEPLVRAYLMPQVKRHLFSPRIPHPLNPPFPTPHPLNPPFPTRHALDPPFPTRHALDPPFPTPHPLNPPFPTPHPLNPPFPTRHALDPPFPTRHARVRQTMLTPDPWRMLRPFPAKTWLVSLANLYNNCWVALWTVVLAVPYMILWLLNFLLVPYFCNQLLRLFITLGFGLQKVYVEEWLRLPPATHSIAHWNVQKILTAATLDQLKDLRKRCHRSLDTPSVSMPCLAAPPTALCMHPHPFLPLLSPLLPPFSSPLRCVWHGAAVIPGEAAATEEALMEAHTQLVDPHAIAQRWRFLWDDAELERKAEESTTLALLKNQVDKMAHNPRISRVAFERELKVVCVTLEERYKDMTGNVELSHGSYFRNHVVIAVIAHFLAHGEVPSWAPQLGEMTPPAQKPAKKGPMSRLFSRRITPTPDELNSTPSQ